MTLSEIVLQRIVKSVYMGFLLHRGANDYAGKTYTLSKADLLRFVEGFNQHTDLPFNRISIQLDDKNYGNATRVQAIGKTILLPPDKAEELLNCIEKVINDNLTRVAKSSETIQLYDLNTLDLLDRSTYNTMGSKYLASNRKRYMVNFMHLYSIGDS